MAAESAIENVVRPAAAEEQLPSLRLLLSGISPAQQISEAVRLLRLARQGQISLDGLFVAQAGDSLRGVVWAQVQPGRTAVLWRPQLAPAEAETTLDPLLTATNDWLSTQNVQLGQSLLPLEDECLSAHLQSAGYRHLADLEFLACEVEATTFQSVEELNYETYTDKNRPRFERIIQETYVGTLDCPALDGVRQIEDVLAGYQATGAFDPARWLLLHREGLDVGCLLLADHPGHDQWELVYMGIVPAKRGTQLGLAVTRLAQRLTQRAGRKRLVLAVDVSNHPALNMYAAAGFLPCERKRVYMRRFR